MHIPDGIVSGNISLIGYGISLGLAVFATVRKKLVEEMPKLSLVTAVLFVASIISIPMGAYSVHFSFLGLAGVLLGPMSFLSVAVAVFLQLILFKHGGVSTLGVNILNLGMGALVGWMIFSLHGYFLKGKEQTDKIIGLFAGLAGTMAAVTKVLMGSTVLFLSGFPLSVAGTLFVLHTPIMLIEGIATALLATALFKLKKL